MLRNRELYDKYVQLKITLGSATKAIEVLSVVTNLSYDTVRGIVSHKHMREL